MAYLKPIPDHFRSQDKFDAYIEKLRKELVPLLISNISILQWIKKLINGKHHNHIDLTISQEEEKYTYFKNMPHNIVSGCSKALGYLLEGIRSHQCIFMLDKNEKLFVLKTEGTLGVFDVYGRKFGCLSNDIYIFNQGICGLSREVMI